MKKHFIVLSLVAGFIIGASALSALATGTWNPPPSSPPSNNVDAPINVGSLLQEKAGPLLLDTNLGILGNLVIATGSPAAGKVLTAIDDTGVVTWGNNGGGSENGIVFINPVVIYQTANDIGVPNSPFPSSNDVTTLSRDWTTFSLPTSIPNDATAIIVQSEWAMVWPDIIAADHNYQSSVAQVYFRKDVSSPTYVLTTGAAAANEAVAGGANGIFPVSSSHTVDYKIKVGFTNGLKIKIIGYVGNLAGAVTASSALPSCSEGQTLKMVSGSWACANTNTFSLSYTGTVNYAMGLAQGGADTSGTCGPVTGTGACSGRAPKCTDGNSLISYMYSSSYDGRWTWYNFKGYCVPLP